MPYSPRLRMMTYNVHRCVGRDGRLSPARIAAAVAEQRPDVVALQELDVGRARTGYAHQASLIAEALQMQWFFHPAHSAEDEHYGDALLSRFPTRLIRGAALPTLDDVAGLERRGALWAAIEWHGRPVQFLTNASSGLVEYLDELAASRSHRLRHLTRDEILQGNKLLAQAARWGVSLDPPTTGQ